MRDTVFISHANPEQNEYTRWLALRLTNAGYKVWSDVTALIGGEPVWSSVETAIREHSVRFIFILSRESNSKAGTIKELALADTIGKKLGISDFIIPVKADDIAYSDTNILIHQLNIIDSSRSWADGLSRLLLKLEKDSVPRPYISNGPGAVSDWWKKNIHADSYIQTGQETLLSNWFPLTLPRSIYIHQYSKLGEHDLSIIRRSGYAFYRHADSLISYATAADLNGIGLTSSSFDTESWIQDKVVDNCDIDLRTRRNAVLHMLRFSLQTRIRRDLPVHYMANNRQCAYFTHGLTEGKLIAYDIPNICSGRRVLEGKYKRWFWHFGISVNVQIEPVIAAVVHPHVLFSDDGIHIWESDKKLHRARRSACKQWWNQHWRDRIMAAVHWIARKADSMGIAVPVSSTASVIFSTTPHLFICPVTFDESESSADDIEHEYSDSEDDDHDDVEGN